VDAVREERATYTIERGGTPVARLEPVEKRACTLRDLAAVLETLESPDAEYLQEVEQAVARSNRPVLPAVPWDS
jgi:antitoxin (DNA-binding transcriptional repressor) of toxin-antitoxin stability system